MMYVPLITLFLYTFFLVMQFLVILGVFWILIRLAFGPFKTFFQALKSAILNL